MTTIDNDIEPARGDAVRVEPAAITIDDALDAVRAAIAENTSLRRRLARLEDVETGREACCAGHEDALRSIATALGMSPDALPGAIVEQVEGLVREQRYAISADTLERLRKQLDARGELLLGAVKNLDRVRLALGLPLHADVDETVLVINGLADEAQHHGETIGELRAMHRRAQRAESRCARLERRLAKRDATIEEQRAAREILDASDGETTLDAARRVASDCDTHLVWMRDRERERDDARRDAAAWKLQAESIEAALGDACTGDLTADVRRVVGHRDALLAAAEHAVATSLAAEDGGPVEREAARTARHALRHAAARARAGAGPVGVVLSREDAAVVRAVLHWAEKYERGDNGSPEMLDGATRAWIEAGRPLASKEA